MEPFVPFIRDLDRVGLVEFTAGRHPHFICVANYLLQVLWVHGVQDVKEILSRRTLAFGPIIGEEDDELLVLRQARPQILDGKLIILGDIDVVHVLLLEQQLLIGEHLLQEVLVDLGLGRKIVLD